ncbi:redoxin domain-containing protein [Nonomuraea glycinis]|uniref:redoxin domain-containing protein n=1 Tax=Nonomuraea glycinis TaxID=2047744 RepID=UPI002E15265C|nr:redoxin domain-containing protein [Nonomuraea glycinis]
MIRPGIAALAVSLLVAACGTGTPSAEPDRAASPTAPSAEVDGAATPGAPSTETGSAAPAGTSTSAAPEPTAASPRPATTPAALKFSARTLDGRPFDGGTLAGKPVVFWFWAPWCSKCRSDAPAVKAAVGKHQDVRFVGVAGLDTEPAMKEFVRSTGTGGFVHLSDRKGAVWTKLGVTQQSVFVFMKADGSTEKVTGPLGADGLAARIAKIQAG